MGECAFEGNMPVSQTCLPRCQLLRHPRSIHGERQGTYGQHRLNEKFLEHFSLLTWFEGERLAIIKYFFTATSCLPLFLSFRFIVC